MFLVLTDDLTLHVYDSVNKMNGDIEGVDVEACATAIFDEHGQRYAVKWITSNRQSRFLWIFNSFRSGYYDLEKMGDPDSAAVRAIVDQAVGLKRSKKFSSITEVRAALRN